MPLCPQISITPVTVTSTGMTTSNTAGVYSLDSSSPAFTAVQSTANGKNKITYSTTTPGATPNTAGDLWWQYSGSTIIGQWTGAGGTSWTANTVGNAIIANLDAGKITTGILSSIQIENGVGSPKPFSVNSAGAITATSGTVGGFTLGTNSLTAASNVNFYMSPALGIIQAPTLQATGTGTASINTNGGVTANGATSTFLKIQTSSTAADSVSSGGGLNVTGDSILSGTLRVDGGTDPVGISTPGTTTSADTWRVLSGGGYFLLKRPSSTARLKEHIIPITDIPEFDPQLLLQVPVRAFKFKPGVLSEHDTRIDMFMPGFIAEELDAIYPIAVEYDDEGLPRSYGDSMIVPGMLALIQQQAAKITELEARIEALENA